MDLIKEYQDELIEKTKNSYSPPLSSQVIEAFYHVPRHQFIKRYRRGDEWIEITSQNLAEHLPLLYSDKPLVIFGEEEDFRNKSGRVSTISQPSFVLYLLDLLQLKKGHKVFELGTGSGWNAALMGFLVGKQGIVVSVEIIPELVKTAQAMLVQFDLPQVKIFQGDAGEGFAESAPYDRAIFTAGASDLPEVFYHQLKPKALLLFVLKNSDQADTLIVLQKQKDHFSSLHLLPCGFVPMTGKYQRISEPHLNLPPLHTLQVKIYPKAKKLKAKANEWLIVKEQSQFLWSK